MQDDRDGQSGLLLPIQIGRTALGAHRFGADDLRFASMTNALSASDVQSQRLSLA